MSVFTFQSTLPPPPRYSATRHQPPPYAPTTPSPLTSHPFTSLPSIQAPPPTYSPHTSTRSNSQSLRAKTPSPQPHLNPPPSYTPSSTASSRLKEARRREQEENAYILYNSRSLERNSTDREESDNWCCYCFWVGPMPSSANNYAYYIF